MIPIGRFSPSELDGGRFGPFWCAPGLWYRTDAGQCKHSGVLPHRRLNQESPKEPLTMQFFMLKLRLLIKILR
jgi:hypothetical protein